MNEIELQLKALSDSNWKLQDRVNQLEQLVKSEDIGLFPLVKRLEKEFREFAEDVRKDRLEQVKVNATSQFWSVLFNALATSVVTAIVVGVVMKNVGK